MEYRFKEIREMNELKQKQVSEHLNLSRGGYANIEAEIANIKLNDFLDFCNIFDCSMDYVSNLTNENNNKNLIKINKIDKVVVAKHLNQIEKDNNIMAKDIANFLGIYRSTYSTYKNTKLPNLIQTLMLKKICAKFGYSMDWIIGRSKNKYYK